MNRSIRSDCRNAYKNRYAFDRVTISADGKITGHWNNSPVTSDLGHIDDCRTVEKPKERGAGVRFYNRDQLIYTFAART